MYTETKKLSNILLICISITEIHVEINTDFVYSKCDCNLFNTKYFMHRCKISFVWSAVPVIKCFEKDQMSIFYHPPRTSEMVPNGFGGHSRTIDTSYSTIF